jgi:hypothetical protein
MQTDNNYKPFLTALIIIGVIIIIMLARPRVGQQRSYSMNGYNLSASATRYVPIEPTRGTYSVIRYVPERHTTRYSVPTSYSYSYTDTYTSDTNGTMFPDGCTLTSPYSLTTGLPCS